MTIGRSEVLIRDLTSRGPIVQAIVAAESGNRSCGWIGAEGGTASGGRVVEDTPFFIAGIDKLYNAAFHRIASHDVPQVDRSSMGQA